jgi:hypothetical protein
MKTQPHANGKAKQKPWGKVSREWNSRVKGCGGLTVRLMNALATYSNREGKCWPSYATLASDLGVSTRSVKRALPELVGRGIILRIDLGSGKTPNVYYLDVSTGDLTSHEPEAPVDDDDDIPW